MTVHREYPMAHAMFERNHGDDIHPRVAKLKGHYCKVRLHLVKKSHFATILLLHLLTLSLYDTHKTQYVLRYVTLVRCCGW